jgi:hypothetical protein
MSTMPVMHRGGGAGGFRPSTRPMDTQKLAWTQEAIYLWEFAQRGSLQLGLNIRSLYQENWRVWQLWPMFKMWWVMYVASEAYCGTTFVIIYTWRWILSAAYEVGVWHICNNLFLEMGLLWQISSPVCGTLYLELEWVWHISGVWCVGHL